MKYSEIISLYYKFSTAVETNSDFSFSDHLNLQNKKNVLIFLRTLDEYHHDMRLSDELDYLPSIEVYDDFNYELFFALDESLKSDRDVILQFIECPGLDDFQFEHVGENLKADYEFMITVIGSSYISPKHASLKLTSNKDFMLEVVACDGCDLKYASDNLKDDEEVALKALKKSGSSIFEYVSERLKLSEEFILKAIQIDIRILVSIDDSKFSNSFKEQVAFIKNKQLKNFEKCFKKDPNFLMYFGDPFQDPAIRFGGNGFLKVIGFKMDFYKAMYAVSKNGALLNYLDDSLRDNPKIIDAALNENKYAIKYVTKKKLKLKKYAKYLRYLDEEHEFDEIPF